MPPALRNDPDAAMAAYNKYGSIGEMPDRVDQLMLSIEAVEGKWLGLGDLTGTGLDRRCPTLEYRCTSGAVSLGRFDGLLDKPERKQQRDAIMEKFAAKMRAAGLDPHAPSEGEPGGAYEKLEHILIVYPDQDMPDNVIDTFVAVLGAAQRMREATRAGH